MAWRLHDEIELTTKNGLLSFSFILQKQEILTIFKKYDQNGKISLENVIDFFDVFLLIDEVANYIKNNGITARNKNDLKFGVNKYVFYNGKFYYKFDDKGYIAQILGFVHDILYYVTAGFIKEDEVFYVDYED